MNHCEICRLEFSVKIYLLKHIHVEHVMKKQKQEKYLSSIKRISGKNNVLGIFSTYNIFPVDEKCHDFKVCLNEMRPYLSDKIMKELIVKTSVGSYNVMHIIKNCI